MQPSEEIRTRTSSVFQLGRQSVYSREKALVDLLVYEPGCIFNRQPNVIHNNHLNESVSNFISIVGEILSYNIL